MIKFKIINSSIKLKESDIFQVEMLLNKKFPKELREFYLRNNGGEVEDDRNVYTDEEDNVYDLKTFMPIKYKRTDGDSLLEQWTISHCNEMKLIPENYIVFAFDGGAAPYCCDIETGHIYFVDFDNDDDDPESRMVLICETLEKFINNMKTEEEAYG